VAVLPTGFQIRFEGSKRAIAARDEHWKVMGEILPTAKAKLEATMRAYCDRGPQDLPPGRFKFEEQYEHGGKMARVEAFKTRHVRIYGACGHLGGRPVFLITGTDVAKKTDAADQKKLKAAGKLAHDLIHAGVKAAKK
jgi:hypothetical protein